MKTNIYIGIISLLFSVGYYSMTLPLLERSTRSGAGIHPVFYPQLLAFLMAFFSILLIIQGVHQLKVNKNKIADDQQIIINRETITLTLKNIIFSHATFTIVIAVLYALTLTKVGYIVATPIALFLLIIVMGVRNIKTIIAVPVVTTAVLYLVFSNILGVLLP